MSRPPTTAFEFDCGNSEQVGIEKVLCSTSLLTRSTDLYFRMLVKAHKFRANLRIWEVCPKGAFVFKTLVIETMALTQYIGFLLVFTPYCVCPNWWINGWGIMINFAEMAETNVLVVTSSEFGCCDSIVIASAMAIWQAVTASIFSHIQHCILKLLSCIRIAHPEHNNLK